MQTSPLLFLALLALCVLSAHGYSPKHGAARHGVHRVVRGMESAQAESTGPLVNPDNNEVIDFDLGHYFIYYGSGFGPGGADEATPAAIEKFIGDISNSEYLNILPQYYGGASKTPATRVIHFAGQTLVGAPYGTVVGDVKERCGVKIIDRILSDPSYGITFDPKVQYYAIYGSEITFPKGGLCDDSDACGLHDQQNHKVNGVDTPYICGWIGTFAEGCSVKNELANAAGGSKVVNILSTLAHEITETITDPNQNPSSARAWQTEGDGSEIGDLCGDYFGSDDEIKPSTKVADAYYNVLANGNEYYIQGAWSNLDNACSIGQAIEGASPSNSAAVVGASKSGAALPSSSVEPSSSQTPSHFELQTSGCITFGDLRTFKRLKKFAKICTKNLGGTASNTTTATQTDLCCTGITKFVPFSWSVSALNCEYGIPVRKQQALCDAVGGRTSCSFGTGGAVRITCSR